MTKNWLPSLYFQLCNSFEKYDFARSFGRFEVPRNRTRNGCGMYTYRMKSRHFETRSVNFVLIGCFSLLHFVWPRRSIKKLKFTFPIAHRVRQFEKHEKKAKWLYRLLMWTFENIPTNSNSNFPTSIRCAASGNSPVRTAVYPLLRIYSHRTSESIDIISFVSLTERRSTQSDSRILFLLFFLLCVNISRNH